VIGNASVHNLFKSNISLFKSNISVTCDEVNTVEPGYNDIGLCGTSYIPSNIMSYQLIPYSITSLL
jgi:hypothetical protein